MHKSSSATNSRGGGPSSDRNDPSGVKFAKLRYFWEESSSVPVENNSHIDVTHTTIAPLNNTSEKVVIKLRLKD